MTQYNSLNVKLSNSQLNKLKSSIKNETDVVLRISSNMVSNSKDNTNFPHELLLTNRQVANILKAFAKNTSTDIKKKVHKFIFTTNPFIILKSATFRVNFTHYQAFISTI